MYEGVIWGLLSFSTLGGVFFLDFSILCNQIDEHVTFRRSISCLVFLRWEESASSRASQISFRNTPFHLYYPHYLK